MSLTATHHRPRREPVQTYPGVKFVADDVIYALRQMMEQEVKERTSRGAHETIEPVVGAMSNVLAGFESAAYCVARGLPCTLRATNEKADQ